jgi:hypothetical protein
MTYTHRLFVALIMSRRGPRERCQLERLGFLVGEILLSLSRRDSRTQPGVLTPGIDQEKSALKGRKVIPSARL